MSRRRPTIIVAFLGLLVALAFTFRAASDNSTTDIRDSSLQDAKTACTLANVLIIESNKRIASHRLDTRVLQDFLAISGDTSQRDFNRSGDASDLRAAKVARQLSRDLSGTKFVPVKATKLCAQRP